MVTSRNKRAFILIVVMMVGFVILSFLFTQMQNSLALTRVSSRTSDYVRMGFLEQSAVTYFSNILDDILETGNSGQDRNLLEAEALFSIEGEEGSVTLQSPTLDSDLDESDVRQHPEAYRTTSIFNTSDRWCHSFLGPNTVPPSSALIILSTQVSGYNKRSVFMLGRPTVYISNTPGVFAARRLALGGKTNVTSVDLNDDGRIIAGKLVVKGSKRLDESEEKLALEGNAKLNLNGGLFVTRNSNDEQLNDLVQASKGTLAEYEGASDKVGRVQIQRVINKARRVFPEENPTSFSGQGLLQEEKVVSSSLYVGGDVVLEDNLVLEEDAVLFVDGSLKVKGSISGKGSIYVKDGLTCKGNVDFQSAEDKSVAIAAGGDIRLKSYQLDLSSTNYNARSRKIANTVSQVRDALNRAVVSLEGADPTSDVPPSSFIKPLRNAVEGIGTSLGLADLDRRIDDQTDGFDASGPEDGRFQEYINIVSADDQTFSTPHKQEARDIYVEKLELLNAILENDSSGFQSVDNIEDRFELTAGWDDLVDSTSLSYRDWAQGIAGDVAGGTSPPDPESLTLNQQAALWLTDPELFEMPCLTRDILDCTTNTTEAEESLWEAINKDGSLARESLFKVTSIMNQLDFQDPTAARFQGILYATGNIIVEKPVGIYGTLVAQRKKGVGGEESGGVVKLREGGNIVAPLSADSELIRLRSAFSAPLLRIE